MWVHGDATFNLCVLFLCAKLQPVSQSVSPSVSLHPRLSRCPFAVQLQIRNPLPALHFPPAGFGSHHAVVISRWQPLRKKKKNNPGNKRVCAWRKKTSLRREMSAISPELVPIGEPSQAGAEAGSQQATGILQPQTVFVILDPAETLNLVRWVR